MLEACGEGAAVDVCLMALIAIPPKARGVRLSLQAQFLRRSIRVTLNSRIVRVRRRRTSAAVRFERRLLIE
jgi:hypothetical protein